MLGLTTTLTAAAQSALPLETPQAQQTADVKTQTTEMLRRSRVAMKGGNLELAERYVGQAEAMAKQAGIKFEGFLNAFADSPAKVRRDLAKLKATQPRQGQAPTAQGQQQLPPGQLTPAQVAQIQAQGVQQRQPNRLPLDIADHATALAPAGQQQAQLQARTMMAQAQAAFGRGDLNMAETLVRQAQTLNVPQQAFAGGDSPWELGLKINRQRQLMGVAPAANNQVAASTPNVSPAIYDPTTDQTFVRPAAAEEPVPPTNMLAQQLNGLNPLTRQPPPVSLQGNQFNPAAGQQPANVAPVQLFPTTPDVTPTPTATPAPPATYQDVQSVTIPATGSVSDLQPTPTPATSFPTETLNTQSFAPAGSSPGLGYSPMPAQELINMGETALREKNLESAREYFLQAWSMKDSLDPGTKQRLQDHLQLIAGNRDADSSSEEDDEETEAEREERARINRFVSDVQREQASIARDVDTRPKAAWEAMKRLREQVQENDIPPEVRRPLLGRLDEAVRQMEAYIDANRAQIELDEQNREVLAAVDRERRMRVEIETTLAGMLDEFNEMMHQQRFSEAYVLAKKARELDPVSEITESMVWKSRFAERLFVEKSLQERRERSFEYALEGGTLDAPIDDYRNPIAFPKQWKDLVNRRDGLLANRESRYSEEEQAIERALRKKVPVQFDEAPLAEVVDTLGKLTGINMFLDREGLAAEGVSSDTPISINLPQDISLKSVLNLILGQHRLDYMIQDEVLRITSEQASAGDVYVDTYYVGDLVIPIPNFMPGYNNGMAGMLAEAHAALGYGPGGWANQRNNGRRPLVIAQNSENDQNVGSPMALSQLTSANTPGMPATPPPASGLGGASGADFTTLINLITSTVEPNSWDELGGPGAVESFEGNLSLVISNTQEVHDQIKDLLEQLRKLQDLQVTIEVRFVTLQDNFFERIGVDFDFDINDNSGFTSGDLDGTNADSTFQEDGSEITIGLDPQGNPTLDLDLGFSQNTFASAVPAFGGFDPNAAASFGFAILSDIEAFFVIEAIQGDTRTNVMQAPKLTMFNGQFASITDTSNRPFVTTVVPVVGDFAVAQQPVILVLAEGTQLSVQAVVSSDRRFVRLTMLPMFSQIGDVDTFTFDGETSSNTGSSTETDPDANETTTNNNVQFSRGTTVQLPNFAVTSVSTTVSVPDGGTVLMGGIKRLAEGRNERGMPILSKLPYINRLFKNVGIGRETQTLMMMVTPRIIIQEEEEERILGSNLP